MNKLFLTVAITSTLSLYCMESPKQLTPITLPQTYHYLAGELLPELAQQIFALQFGFVDPTKFLNKIEQSVNSPKDLVKYINTLIRSCGYLLASELCDWFFHHAKISICDIKNDSGQTSLHYVASYFAGVGDSKIDQILIKIARDNAYKLLTMQCDRGCTALHEAACNTKCVGMVKFFLDTAGDNAFKLLAVQDKYGRTAMHEATQVDNIEVVKLFLAIAGDNIWNLLNIEENTYGRTVFGMFESQEMHTMVILTALHFAASNDNIEMVTFFLNIAGDYAEDFIHMPDHNGKTAFDIASQKIKKVMQEFVEERS